MSIYPEIDEKGRHFRRVGNIIEYEPIITTSFGNIPESQLEEARRKDNEQRQKRLQELNSQIKSVKQCPLKKSTCYNSCAWWSGSECLLTCSKAFTEGNNKQCPISQKLCQKDCALMRDNKCILLSNMRGEKEND